MEKELFINLLRETKRCGIEELILYLENSDFFEAPASSKYHMSQECGLLKHSLNVYYNLLKLNDNFYSKDVIIIVSLLHDLCKANTYVKSYKSIKNKTGKWESVQTYLVNELLPLGHGEKSVIIAEKYIDLTVEEMLAIRWHMGGYENKENYSKINQTFSISKLAVLLHMADLKATYIDEVDYVCS